MTRNSRFKSRQRRARSNAVASRRGVYDLDQLVELNKQQITRMMPVKPDMVMPRQSTRDKVYTFWETITAQTIQGNATEVDFAISFTPSSLTNLGGSFVNCFDAYRIIGIKIAFHPYVITATVACPPITTAIDYDDATVITVANLLQYDTAQTVPAGVYFERTFFPRQAGAAYSGVFTSFQQEKNQWNDMGSLGIIQYGLKGGVPGTASVGAFNLYATTLTCCYQVKNSR